MKQQNQKILARGAEAILTKQGSKVLKDRIPKGYRHPQLDTKLRKRRTKSETKLITKASSLIPTPKVVNPINNKPYNSNENSAQKYINNKSERSEQFQITMQYITGKKLSDHLDKLKNYQTICKQIGKNIALLHNAGIIHGDLTTSNMIYVPNKEKNNETHNSDVVVNNSNNKSGSQRLRAIVFFIDFGLGFHSNRVEDKAVDLHLISEALEAKHPEIYKKAFQKVLEGYKKHSNNSQKILTQLKKVEKRGRYKAQY